MFSFVRTGFVLLFVFDSFPLAAQGQKEFGLKLVEGARVSISRRPVYDNRYVRMQYPLGDPG